VSTSNKPDDERVVLEFRSAPGATTPFHVRLRHLLKHALRSLHLRCEAIRWPDADSSTDTAGDAAQAHPDAGNAQEGPAS
jgi:hypothetical protein